MKSSLKKFWKYIQPVIILAAFYLIFRNVKFSLLMDTFHRVKWPFVLLFFFTSLGLMTFQGIRWWILIRSFTEKLTFFHALSIHFSSMFYSIILPNSTAQEVVRTIDASKKTGYVIGWSSAWISKIIGIFVSFIFSLTGLIFIQKNASLPTPVFYIIISLFLLMCVSLLLSFSKKVTRRIRLIFNRLFPRVSIQWVNTIREGIYKFREKKKGLLLSFLATVISQMLLVSAISILIFSITGNFFFIEVIAFIPLIEMVSMAQPFTPGGIGVREALVAIMFKHLELSDENLATYIILSNLTIFLKLIGVIPLIITSFKEKHRQHQQNKI